MDIKYLDNGDMQLVLDKKEADDVTQQLDRLTENHADPDGVVLLEGWADSVYVEVLGCNPDDASAKTLNGHKVNITIMDTFADDIAVDDD